MRARLLAAAFAAALVTTATGAVVLSTAPAHAQAAATLSGDWKGAYISSDGADVNTFDIKLRQSGAALSGTVIEVNAIADARQALFLTSTIAGSVRGAEIDFVKTYDGSGGASHTVRYRGRLEPNGRRIRGSYQAGDLTGSFEMVR